MSEPLLERVVPIELTNGNDGRTKHFGQSAKRRKQYAKALRLLGWKREPFTIPVRVRVTRLLGKGQRFWDSSSCGRGNWKEIEDALVELGWFVDDGPKWIVATDFRQEKQKDKSLPPAVRVEVFEA